MRTLRLASALAVLAALSACGDPVEPSTRQLAPGERPHRIGIYLGSGHSVVDSTSTPDEPSALADTTAERGGSGYIGSGH